MDEVDEEPSVTQAIRPAYYGFGIEVWWTFAIISTCGLASIIYLIIFKASSTPSPPQIDPQQEDTMNRVRARLSDHRPPGDRSTSARRRSNQSPPLEQPPSSGSTVVIQCPVCLDNVVYPIETNCGHIFCTQCILQYWHIDRFPRACRCPVCRREVTLIITDQRYKTNEQYSDLRRQVNDYNRRMSGEPRSLRSYLEDVPVLLRNLWRDLFTINGIMWIHRFHVIAVVVLLFLYILLPMDILPESFLGIVGLIDDLLVIIGTLIYLTILYREVITRHT